MFLFVCTLPTPPFWDSWMSCWNEPKMIKRRISNLYCTSQRNFFMSFSGLTLSLSLHTHRGNQSHKRGLSLVTWRLNYTCCFPMTRWIFSDDWVRKTDWCSSVITHNCQWWSLYYSYRFSCLVRFVNDILPLSCPHFPENWILCQFISPCWSAKTYKYTGRVVKMHIRLCNWV